jgi:hypothetical protein
MSNYPLKHVAEPGQVYVCGMCGKRSKDQYGDLRIDRGWDESCMLHAVLCDEASLKFKAGVLFAATSIGLDSGKLEP